jgi:hypothetical protein
MLQPQKFMECLPAAATFPESLILNLSDLPRMCTDTTVFSAILGDQPYYLRNN